MRIVSAYLGISIHRCQEFTAVVGEVVHVAGTGQESDTQTSYRHGVMNTLAAPFTLGISELAPAPTVHR
jgi:hypothetical protein